MLQIVYAINLWGVYHHWPLGHRLSFDQALSLISQLLQALSFAHQHGIIHRDIKPGSSNIFFSFL